MAQLAERRRRSDEEYAGITTRLDDIITRLVDFEKREAARAHIDDDVKKLKEAVQGNGKPGLKSEVQLIRDQLDRLNWAAGAVVMGIIADVLTRILAK